jgi:hypothetical protein
MRRSGVLVAMVALLPRLALGQAARPEALRRPLATMRHIDSILPTLQRIHVPYSDTSLARIDNYAYFQGSEPLAIVEQWCNPLYCVVDRFYFESRALFAAVHYRDEPSPNGQRRLIPGTRNQYFFRGDQLAYWMPPDSSVSSSAFSDDVRGDADHLYGGGMAYLRMTLHLPRPDEFAGVRCGDDVVGAMRGKKVTGGRVIELETAHQDLQLKISGGMVISDSLFFNGWSICGRDYEFLQTARIEDGIQLPPHSRRQPEFLGSCKRDGRDEPGFIVAVLDNPAPNRPGDPVYSADDSTLLAAIAAWRVDENAKRFVPLDLRGLRCPRGGIISRDGGM